MKTAILGAGTIVPDFLEASVRIKELEVYAIMGQEQDLPKMEEFQKQYGISKIYHNYDALLKDANVEVVYVALPNHLHYTFAKKAIELGKHVMIEKPFTSTYAQAQELIELAEKHHVMVFEAISNQYMPNYIKTRELVKELGDVKIVQMNYSQYSRRYDLFKEGVVLPVFDPKKAGGALMDLNVYNIHYITGLFGKPDRVSYVANTENGIDTSGILILEYPSFQCVSVGAKDCKAPVSINIQGDKGFIHSDAPSNVYDSFVLGFNSKETKNFALNKEMPRLYYELKAFSDMVNSKNYDQARGYNHHTLTVMEILDEARRQAGIETDRKESMPQDIPAAYTQTMEAVCQEHDYTPRCLEVLEEQENTLCYEYFGSREALFLGNAIVALDMEYDREISVRITREEDGAVIFQHLMDSKSQRNVEFMEKKRQAVLETGHSSLWVYVEGNLNKKRKELYEKQGKKLPGGGAFPLKAKGKHVATVAVSGLHEGKDHELLIRALEKALKKKVPVFPGTAV